MKERRKKIKKKKEKKEEKINAFSILSNFSPKLWASIVRKRVFKNQPIVSTSVTETNHSGTVDNRLCIRDISLSREQSHETAPGIRASHAYCHSYGTKYKQWNNHFHLLLGYQTSLPNINLTNNLCGGAAYPFD